MTNNLLNTEERDRHFLVNVLEYVTNGSPSLRKKVGCIIVNRNNFICGQGFNSMPRFSPSQKMETPDGKSKPEVVHAEFKAIAMAAKDGVSVDGSTLYCTIPPCPVCCQLIIEAGIRRVVYAEDYWSKENIYLLTDAGIEVSKLKTL